MSLAHPRVVIAPWTYGFIVALAMWIATTVYSGLGSAGSTLSAALAFGAFSVTVGTGQMLVIASGPGNIDLSVPSVMALAAYVSMTIMHESNSMTAPGLLAALAVGAVAGALNFLAITALRLPPIIATLAWSFVFQSFTFNFGGEATLKPPEILSWFAVWRVGGVQAMPVAVMILTLVMMIVLRRSVFGRQLLAAGQSERAADLAGVEVGRVRLTAYMLCGTAAALTGFLLSGFTGGAALNMGDTYLMESIAVVVLGGTSVAGGQANPLGIWGAALFFNLMATMLNTFHFEAGVRFLLTGVLIILIVAIAPRARGS
ncbi:ABC transporter permease [Methylocapsa sp. S129]|uniref:ABC transporter permease n=1 Tax=Methylocapsa sp. S129 TaxID=1641869 RepID=UPI00131E118A|nr:ABC transporter permease [Methylocapsa sp. S129]